MIDTNSWRPVAMPTSCTAAMTNSCCEERSARPRGVSIGGDYLSLFVSELRAEPEDQAFWLQRSPRISSIRALSGALEVEEQGDWSGILMLSVEGRDPESVRDQANEIANVYVRQNVERKSAEAAQTLEFLDEQLPIVRQDMEAAELALNSYRLEKGSIDLPLETQSILETIVTLEAR